MADPTIRYQVYVTIDVPGHLTGPEREELRLRAVRAFPEAHRTTVMEAGWAINDRDSAVIPPTQAGPG